MKQSSPEAQVHPSAAASSQHPPNQKAISISEFPASDDWDVGAHATADRHEIERTTPELMS